MAQTADEVDVDTLLGSLHRDVAKMRLADLKLLDLNARFMRPEQFQRLVANIARDGGMTQIPFACRLEDGRYEVLSGNHRVQAAIAAGIVEDFVEYTDDPLTASQRRAIQLSHNSIVGEDDPEVLRALYAQVDTVEWKEYSGVDGDAFGQDDPITVDSLPTPGLNFQTVTLLMLPEEAERARAALDEAVGTADETWLVRYADADRLFEQLADVNVAHNVRNSATAVGLILDLAERHLADPWRADDKAKTAPVVGILETRTIPTSTALLFARALDRSGLTSPADLLAAVLHHYLDGTK